MQSRAGTWSAFWETGEKRERSEFIINDSKYSRSEPENKSLAASQQRWREVIINSLRIQGSKYMLWTLSTAGWFQYKWNKAQFEHQCANKTKRNEERNE